MKNIALGIINIILGTLTLMIVMSVYGRMNRSMELQSSLSSIVEETVENMTVNPKYTIHNTNEWLADFVQNLSVRLDTQSDLTVEIMQCNKEKGILSVKVTETYLHPNGKQGTVECERNVILNKLQEDAVESYTVSFYIGTELYKEYLVWEENKINAPVSPQNVTGIFQGWVDEYGNTVDFSQPVTKNIICYADIS